MGYNSVSKVKVGREKNDIHIFASGDETYLLEFDLQHLLFTVALICSYSI